MFAEAAHGLWLSGSQVELREALEQTGAHILFFFSLFSPSEYCCVCKWWSHAEPEARDLFYMHEDILLPASSSDKLDVECGDVSTQETQSVYCLWVEAYSFFSFMISTMSCHGPGHSHILLVLDWQSRSKEHLFSNLTQSQEAFQVHIRGRSASISSRVGFNHTKTPAFEPPL